MSKMIEIDSKTQGAGKFGWFAAQEARMKSLANAKNFDAKLHLKAERMRLVLEMLYDTTEVLVTNRKQWISIKVTGNTVRDKKGLQEMENAWATEGVTKVKTAQGIIYHLVPVKTA